VGLRVGLDVVMKEKIPGPRRESNPDHPARRPALYVLTLMNSNHD